MTEKYIRNHFADIKKYANVIENRLDDEWCTMGIGFKRVLDCVLPGLTMALALARFAEGATFNGKGHEVIYQGLQFFPIAVDGLFGEKVYAVYLGEGLTALILFFVYL